MLFSPFTPGGGLPVSTGVPPYVIYGQDVQVVQVHLNPGEKVEAEPGAFAYSSGAVRGELQGRPNVFAPLFPVLASTPPRLTYTNHGPDVGYIGFSASQAGKIVALDSRRGPVLCAVGAYVCSKGNVKVEMRWFMPDAQAFGCDNNALRVSGQGMVFIQAGGTLVEKPLLATESMLVGAACLVAMSESCKVVMENQGTGLRALFTPAGRSLTVARITGPGTVYVQSLPLSRLTQRIVTQQQRDLVGLPVVRCFPMLVASFTVMFAMLVMLSALNLVTLDELEL